MQIIFGNYGNETNALMVWACQQQLRDVTVVSIDTGWAAPGWVSQVQRGQAYARQNGFAVQHLTALATFSELVKQRGQFPSSKFQWCAGLLKGLSFVSWLDEVDVAGQALILLPKRRQAARRNFDLPEYIENNDHFGGRKVWHPLWQHSLAERDSLLSAAGFEPLTHRSLECDPCIFNSPADFARAPASVQLTALEQEVGQTMFAQSKIAQQSDADCTEFAEQFAGSCGDTFACGQ